ncbi:structural maintenance of chromosomes protein 4-like [Symsagittifera roscoffensis]|uniref:structural maintenance of chromosomes protein 4-like n=1 Tax=Symsagittifera roscoffensis TaxID=84072 RepID=UPI00307BB8AB
MEMVTEEEVNPKPRLIILKLSLENFKSYGGTVELGPFHKKFCCIVGPNGSGKSNVIDALLFVFGFRAAKIRLKKLSMSIHNSDESCQNIPSCSVAVHLAEIIDSSADPNDFTIVAGSELVISRTAYRDNSSNYYINAKKSHFKEVRDLLKSKAVDLDHNRFFTLQGEVEQISQMKPKGLSEHDEGLLEYLENIIGTYQYKELMTLIDSELGELEEKRKDQMKRVALVEGEKNSLEKLKAEAVAFLDLENSISSLKNKIMQKYKELRGANEKAEQLQRQFAEVDQQDVKHRADVKNAREGIPKLNKETETLGKKIEDAQKSVGEKRKQMERMEEELKRVKGTKKELDEEYSAAVESIDTRSLQQEKQTKCKLLISKNETTNKCKSEVDRAHANLDMLNMTRNRLHKQWQQATTAAEKLQQDLHDMTQKNG